jgi:putative membrane protein insertion efficiency factor
MPGNAATVLSWLVRGMVKLPIHLYRFTLRPWLGWPCRHLPTCSDYALEAVNTNGAWRGVWLIVSRLLRCQPWGTAGHDPVPDIRHVKAGWQPWKYGCWDGSNITVRWTASKLNEQEPGACEGSCCQPIGRQAGKTDT